MTTKLAVCGAVAWCVADAYSRGGLLLAAVVAACIAALIAFRRPIMRRLLR